MAHTHTTVEYYSALKKEVLPRARTRTSLEDVVFSEISLAPGDEYPTSLRMCGILKKVHCVGTEGRVVAASSEDREDGEV